MGLRWFSVVGCALPIIFIKRHLCPGAPGRGLQVMGWQAKRWIGVAGFLDGVASATPLAHKVTPLGSFLADRDVLQV